MRTKRHLAVLIALCLAPAARADDPVLEIVVSPGNGSLVSAPAHLRVSLARAGLAPWSWYRGETLKVIVDGKDVTLDLVQRALAAGTVKVLRDGLEIALIDPLPLDPGRHVFDVRITNRWGYVHRAHTDCEVLPAPPAAAPVERVADLTPPDMELDPAHLAFRDDAAAPLTVRFSDSWSGVNASTLTFDLDGTNLLAQSTIQPDRAVWVPPSPLGNGRHVLRASIADRSGNRRIVSSTFVVFDRGSKYPWFFPPTTQPHPLAHTHHQFQLYSSNPSSAYFHHGVDIRRPNGTPVYAPAGGVVTNAAWYGSQPLYFEIAIRDGNGFLWEYHHIDEPTVPASVKQAAQIGGTIAAGTYIGSVVSWPVSAYGMRFHHVHLNIKDPDGRYINPLHLLTDIQDTTAPSCLGIWVMPNTGTSAFAGSPPVVSGDVDVVARLEDLADGEPYQLTLYRTEMEVRELGGTMSHGLGPVTLWRFDNLPGGASRYDGVWDIFKQSFTATSQLHTTQGNYNDRRFYFVLTNSIGGQLGDAAGYWDTDAVDGFGQRVHPNGMYRITVRAWDIRGNTVSRDLDVLVRN